MKHTDRILELYEDLYGGEPWIDSTLLGTLQPLNAKQAAKRVSPQWNTIWEIVNHMISWRMHVLGRLEGEEINVGDDNYIKPIKDRSEKAWQETLSRLEESQEKWTAFLKKFKDNDLDTVNPNVTRTYSDLFHAILMHDTYHLGQLVLLVKRV